MNNPAQKPSIEAEIDHALEETFPASDPPAWYHDRRRDRAEAPVAEKNPPGMPAPGKPAESESTRRGANRRKQ